MAFKCSSSPPLTRGLADKHALIFILKSFANSGNILQGMQAHSLIIQSEIPLHPFLGNTLLSMYAKCGLPHEAAKVLAMMPQKNNVSWVVIITCLAKHGHHDQAFSLFMQMVSQNFTPSEVIFVCVVNMCICHKVLRDGRFVHATIVEYGLDSDMIIVTSLVNMYSKHAYIEDAYAVFDTASDRNVVTWTSIIAGYTDCGSSEEAIILFQRMQCEGLQPDKVTLMSILKACTSVEKLNVGKQYHVLVVNADLKQAISLDNALINMYAKCGRMDIVERLFWNMKKRDVASWSIIIAGHVEDGQPKVALEYFEQMQGESVKPNYVTLISVLKACANLSLLKEGQFVHNSVIVDDFLAEFNVESALIDMYTKCGQIRDAYQVFCNTAKKDVVIWTAIISGYAQQGLNEEALNLFVRMQHIGIEANAVTFASVLCVCAGMAAIKQGTHIHDQICKSDLDANADLCAALVNMYSKCGLLEDARRVFDRMPLLSSILWSTMVTAYAHHGHGKEALKLVEEMQERNMKLDHVSVAAVIVACNNEGLVHEASHLMSLMCKERMNVSSAKHYTCITDALGRAGQVEEAEHLLKSMPFQPNAVSWRSFLGALKNHEGSQLVDNMAENGIDFELNSADDFVLLSNVYSAVAVSRDQGKATL